MRRASFAPVGIDTGFGGDGGLGTVHEEEEPGNGEDAWIEAVDAATVVGMSTLAMGGQVEGVIDYN